MVADLGAQPCRATLARKRTHGLVQLCSRVLPARAGINHNMNPEQTPLHVGVTKRVPIADERSTFIFHADAEDQAPWLPCSGDTLAHLLDARRLRIITVDQI